MNNNPYAEAYLQMNPVVARSYYLDHNNQLNRSNYTLTSEHQKIICILIMLALGCYVVGFAIIMIRQVIKDTEQRANEEIDGCECVKYNGEHCDAKCLATDDLTAEEERNILKEINPSFLSSLTNKQQPIEISLNMDGTYCREPTIENKLNNKLNKSNRSINEFENLSSNLPKSIELNNLFNNSQDINKSFSSFSLPLNNELNTFNLPLNKSNNSINFLNKNKLLLSNDNLDFKQTEIHSNSDDKLLNKVKLFVFQKDKKIKSIEHL